jgi:hypothetical protein
MSMDFHFVPVLLLLHETEPPDPWVLLGRSTEGHIREMYPGKPRIYSSDMFAGKFWFISLPAEALNHPPFKPDGGPPNEAYKDAGAYETASTEEIGTILEHGFSVSVISGPFETRDRARYSLDLFMESGE